MNDLLQSCEQLLLEANKLVKENERLKYQLARGLKVQEALNGTMSYVNKEGNVKLPGFIIKALGLENGGGVVFHNVNGKVTIMTNEQAIKACGFL